ncbi:MAG TPA: hypothetical protein VHM92_12425 [Allosphingosinicella sp.]|nr:hypothetical protein [Allosphingosinicella sp.]
MDEEIAEAPRPALAERFGSTLDRIERIYLKALRAAILFLATGLLLYAAWLGVWSLYKISRSPSSVVEQPATVAPDELTDAEMPVRDASAGGPAAGPKVDPAQQRHYAGFVSRYHALYQTRFEPFRQKEDKPMSRDQFDDAFVKSNERLQAASKGNFNFAEDKADLDRLLAVMTDAAGKPQTQQRLQKYKAARRVSVAKKVQRTRTETREGWDSLSYACAGWYENGGCPTIRTVEVPYVETVRTMEFPPDTQSHTQIFRAFQDRFFALLHDRRDSNRAEAQRKREEITFGKLMGKVTLWTALQIVGGFLVLMFFFLLIAIERHQRRIGGDGTDPA